MSDLSNIKFKWRAHGSGKLVGQVSEAARGRWPIAKLVERGRRGWSVYIRWEYQQGADAPQLPPAFEQGIPTREEAKAIAQSSLASVVSAIQEWNERREALARARREQEGVRRQQRQDEIESTRTYVQALAAEYPLLDLDPEGCGVGRFNNGQLICVDVVALSKALGKLRQERNALAAALVKLTEDDQEGLRLALEAVGITTEATA
jgi:hypothetical protein